MSEVNIWDDENEPHITGPGEVTADDVEQVIRDHPRRPDHPDDYSASTGLPLIHGETSAGKRIVAEWTGMCVAPPGVSFRRWHF